MEIQFVGNVEGLDVEERILDKLEQVLESSAKRIEDEQEGVKINGCVITEATFTVGLKIEGIEEPQLVTVEHHKGHPEIFKWVIDLDRDTEMSNQEESVFDSWSVSTTDGTEEVFQEIISKYDPVDLSFEDEENFSDMDKVTLLHKDGYKVVKVYQHKKLIQEYKLNPIEK